MNPDLLSQVNSCKLPEELASTSFAKTIDAVGTSETLKHGICRAEYDMGPSLSNFIAFMDSDQHDPLRLSVRNKKLTQLLYIGETGELPQNFNRLDWFGTTLSRMHDPLIRQRYSTDQIKEIAHSLTKMIYPDIRVSQNSFTHKTRQERRNNVDSLCKTATDDTGYTRRAVPAQRQGRVKRIPSL